MPTVCDQRLAQPLQVQLDVYSQGFRKAHLGDRPLDLQIAIRERTGHFLRACDNDLLAARDQSKQLWNVAEAAAQADEVHISLAVDRPDALLGRPSRSWRDQS